MLDALTLIIPAVAVAAFLSAALVVLRCTPASSRRRLGAWGERASVDTQREPHAADDQLGREP